MIQEDFNSVNLPGPRGHHECRVPVRGQRAIDVGSGLKQPFDHGCIAVEGREKKRCRAIAVGGRDLRAGADQYIRGREVVRPHGPMQRGCAVDLRCINIGLLQEQGAYRFLIPLLGRICHIAGGRAEKTSRRKQHERTASE